MAHQNTDHCVWNCLESIRGMPYELGSNTDPYHKSIISDEGHYTSPIKDKNVLSLLHSPIHCLRPATYKLIKVRKPFGN